MAAKREPVAISTTVGDAISTAFGIIEDLATEMRDAYDNTPESLQSSGVGEARGEAADALEGISEVDDVPEQFAELKVTFYALPLKSKASRRDRMADGLRYAEEAITALEAYEGADEDGKDGLITDIQSMIDEAEAVEFPGMFG